MTTPGSERTLVSNWPMWVLGLAAMIDNVDQYIVRGASDQIKGAFGVTTSQLLSRL